MFADNNARSDAQAILAKRYDNGWDYWTTPDRRLGNGGPFSALESPLLLLELGMDPSELLLKEVSDLIFSTWREDGRFRTYPGGSMMPCQTIQAAKVLCHLQHASENRLDKTFDHLLQIQHSDGGWRCNKFFFGRGPETEFSNPGPTLTALDAFRFTGHANNERALDRAVEFLLGHWTTRLPLGPCHYGIGSLFMQTMYPFMEYNIFYYVYVLSFYNRAREDERFHQAFSVLVNKSTDGKIVVERVHRKLSGLSFCKKGEVSPYATKRYDEIKMNMRG